MLRVHDETSVAAFQLLYFSWASQPKGKCCLPKSLGGISYSKMRQAKVFIWEVLSW